LSLPDKVVDALHGGLRRGGRKVKKAINTVG
jgi:hypothetical protein